MSLPRQTFLDGCMAPPVPVVPRPGICLFLALWLTALVGSACAPLGQSGAPALPFEDPGRQAWLQQVQQHTREEVLIEQLDVRLMMSATLLSPSLLEAEALEQARVYRYPAEQVRARVEEARARAQASQQLLVWVSAREPRLAELESGLWRVVLVDSSGQQVEPLSVERIRKPSIALRDFYPQLSPLGLTYTLKFPPRAPSGKLWSQEPTVLLQVSGTQGALRVAWANE